MGQIKFITDFDDHFYFNKKIFVRVDFNVKVQDNVVSEDYRIRSAIPTIEYLVKRGAKVILASHLDRPKGKDDRFSLRPVSKKLAEILTSINARVMFSEDCVGSETSKIVNNMKDGDVLLLENLRFYSEEEINDANFSQILSSYADVYINDAFSTSHRKHSSTYGVAKFFDNRIAGFNLAQELQYLSLLKESPPNPFTLVIGGVKIKDKIGALNHLLPKADKVLIGGAASYTFLKAKGYSIGESIIEEDYLPWVTRALQAHSEKIILPLDHKVAHSENSDHYQIIQTDIPKGMRGYDIGDKTIQKFSYEIHNNGLGTIFWNGPMGYFEKEIFSNGTKSVAVSMALAYWRGVKTLIGGGDTLEAMKISGVSEKEVTHVSTGGGATLRFLAGDEMPGIDVLKNY